MEDLGIGFKDTPPNPSPPQPLTFLTSVLGPVFKFEPGPDSFTDRSLDIVQRYCVLPVNAN